MTLARPKLLSSHRSAPEGELLRADFTLEVHRVHSPVSVLMNVRWLAEDGTDPAQVEVFLRPATACCAQSVYLLRTAQEWLASWKATHGAYGGNLSEEDVAAANDALAHFDSRVEKWLCSNCLRLDPIVKPNAHGFTWLLRVRSLDSISWDALEERKAWLQDWFELSPSNVLDEELELRCLYGELTDALKNVLRREKLSLA